MLTMNDWVYLRSLSAQGLSIKAISDLTGFDRKTVSKYIFSETCPTYTLLKPKSSQLDDFKLFIKQKLSKVLVSAKFIYENIKEKGFTGSYSIVKRFIHLCKKKIKYKPTLRFETLPGEQAQVDWAHFGYVRHDGKRKKLFCFLIVLGFSRMAYIEFTTSKNMATFLQCHINAFHYFGGCTQHILYDNLRSVVLKRKLNQDKSEMNPEFMSFAGYYNFKPRLCWPGRPQTKGKVERLIQYVRGNFFADTSFEDLDHLNVQAKNWLKKANRRIHGTTGETPCDRLREEDLTPITDKPDYDLSEKITRKVARDSMIFFKNNRYSVPHRFCGEVVNIKIVDDETIEIFHNKEKICQHSLATGKKQTIVNKDHICGLFNQANKQKHNYLQKI